jgi:Sulfotransferase family
MTSKRGLLARLLGRLRERNDPRAPRLSIAAGSDPLSPPPIFIVGCQRSGTSLVRRILDSHTRIACPPESKFLLPATAILRDTAAIRGLDSMGYDRAEVVAAVRRFAAAFFQGYASAGGKQRWADKTPNYVDCLDEIWELFGPDARFVLVIRNGVDVAHSLADRQRHYPAIDRQVELSGGSKPVGAARFWREQNEKIDAFRALHAEACFTLRYEELTDRPDEALQPLFRFLGEPWEPDVLNYDRYPHHAGIEDPDVRRKRAIEPNARASASWPADVRAAVRAACEPMLSRLGYGEDFDDDRVRVPG